MKKPYLLSLAAIVIFICGCSYSLRMNVYPHLRNVSVLPFDNNTLEIYLAEDMRESLISSFQRDGRLRIAYDNPDSIIEGEIIDYENKIFGYDIEQNVEEYQVIIRLSVSFTDLVKNELIWENKSLVMTERYSPYSAETVKFGTEEKALEEIFKNIFETIIRNSLEAW